MFKGSCSRTRCSLFLFQWLTMNTKLIIPRVQRSKKCHFYSRGCTLPEFRCSCLGFHVHDPWEQWTLRHWQSPISNWPPTKSSSQTIHVSTYLIQLCHDNCCTKLCEKLSVHFSKRLKSSLSTKKGNLLNFGWQCELASWPFSQYFLKSCPSSLGRQRTDDKKIGRPDMPFLAVKMT